MSKESIELAKVHAHSFLSDEGRPPSNSEGLQQQICICMANIVYGKLTSNTDIIAHNETCIAILEKAQSELGDLLITMLYKNIERQNND